MKKSAARRAREKRERVRSDPPKGSVTSAALPSRVLRSSRREGVRSRLASAMVFAASFGALAWSGLWIRSCTVDLPTAESRGARPQSLAVTDRSGVPLAELRGSDGTRSITMPLEAFGEHLPAALIAAEDKRFFEHHGVDLLASVRAVGSVVGDGRMDGASTLSQQLVRARARSPRSTLGKVEVVAMALRLERETEKATILEAYLNEIEFGPRLRGAEAAARHYFDKSSAQLSLAEAAALASIPRGTTLYDPARTPERLTKRRDRVLDRMAASGTISEDEAHRAKQEPLTLAARDRGGRAPHFVQALAAGTVGGCSNLDPPPPDAVRAQSTIDMRLQSRAEAAARSAVRSLRTKQVSAVSVVVLHNETREVLAYVGSPDFDDAVALGQNDGVRALRQPGSSLKPFVYELAMEKGGLHPSSLLPDIDTTFELEDGGRFRPENYDHRFHGPVQLRDALGNSFNVPAVHTVERMGVFATVERLRDVGLCTLSSNPGYYGLGVALGDPEVRLIDLANAYATLAEGGAYLPVRAAIRFTRGDGSFVSVSEASPTRVLDERAAYLVTDILADRSRRLSSFGERSVLELPFPVAAKTGTSKGFRDNIAVGYSSEVTVAVWAGNFDGSSMRGVSGISGAGPVFREVMLAANELFPGGEFVRPEGLREVDVCPLSGKAPGPDCDRHEHALLLAEARDLDRCDMHEQARITADGERADAPCAVPADTKVFEKYPAEFMAWAEQAGRPVAPVTWAQPCGVRSVSHVRVTFPREGDHFSTDEASSSESAILLRAAGREATFVVDGRAQTSSRWKLRRGAHTVIARAPNGGESPPVRFFVD